MIGRTLLGVVVGAGVAPSRDTSVDELGVPAQIEQTPARVGKHGSGNFIQGM